jgi:L,D-transpeptidase catalytic domain
MASVIALNRGLSMILTGMGRALAIALVAAVSAGSASSQPVALGGKSIGEVAAKLKPGEYAWTPEAAPEGPALLVVNLQTQRAILFRNGVAIGASTVSTGKQGYETPMGVFTILQKRKEHYSKTYNNAPMPNMQRLTWKGVALHAGNLPGFPASHGCIRLPLRFSSLLFDATALGMTVIITSVPAIPLAAATPDLATPTSSAQPLAQAPFEWHPERSQQGIVSVIVSTRDQRAIVLRDGIEIGSAPARVSSPEEGAWAYALRAWDESGQHWVKLRLSGPAEGMEVAKDEGRRFETPVGFRRALATVLRPGSTIIVTPQSLAAGSPGSALTVIDNGDEAS